MNDDFEPRSQLSIEELTEKLKSVCGDIKNIEVEVKELLKSAKVKIPGRRELNRKRYYPIYKQITEKNKRRQKLYAIKSKLKKELEEKMNAASCQIFSDETVQSFNECLGFCYGKCIYIAPEGELLYREADAEDADGIGEPAADSDRLISLNTLSDDEITMIKNYLIQSDATPVWFKEIKEK